MIALALGLALLGGAPPGGLQWERNFDEASRRARVERKALLVDFWADWCGWCHRLDQTTYADPEVVRRGRDFVAVKVNTEGAPRDRDVAKRYDVKSLPTIAFISPGGRPILRLNGFQGPGQFPRTMEVAHTASRRIIAWEDALARDPDDAVALTALGAHLFEQADYDESRSLLVHATRIDSSLPANERKRTRLILAVMQNHDALGGAASGRAQQLSGAEGLLKEALAIRPLGDEDPKLLFMLGKVYLSWGRVGEARGAFQRIISEFPESTVAPKAKQAIEALPGH